MSQKTYVLALSGGVDSMALLDAIVNDRLNKLTDKQLLAKGDRLIVAHFDHGIRKDSSSDEIFARGVAEKCGLEYISERVELGANASEDAARSARYNFLRRCCKKYNAQLLTAHHQDDLLETMIINIIRGTSWRGLVSLDSDSDILRPLLAVPKSRILDYANKHNLQWREDSTNSDETYLRNYIRRTLMPRILEGDPDALHKLLKVNEDIKSLKKDIATELQSLIRTMMHSDSLIELPRYTLIMLPRPVAQELIYHALTNLDPSWHPQSQHIQRALHFAKTGLVGKRIEVSGSLKIVLSKGTVQFKNV